jgi:hypothetical protein
MRLGPSQRAANTGQYLLRGPAQPGHRPAMPLISTDRLSVPGERADTGEDEVTELAVTIDSGLQLFRAQPADGDSAKASGVGDDGDVRFGGLRLRCKGHDRSVQADYGSVTACYWPPGLSVQGPTRLPKRVTIAGTVQCLRARRRVAGRVSIAAFRPGRAAFGWFPAGLGHPQIQVPRRKRLEVTPPNSTTVLVAAS